VQLGLADQPRDIAEARARAGSGDFAHAVPREHHRARKKAALLACLGSRVRDFVLRLGFAGQLRFIKGEIRGAPHDSIGVQDVALAEEQQVARHQFGGRNFDCMSIAQYPRARGATARASFLSAPRERASIRTSMPSTGTITAASTAASCGLPSNR
jgi:hypothetical protein